MRNFQVTLTFKVSHLNRLYPRSVKVIHQRVMDVELEDSYCLSPEEFCDSIISLKERPNIIRINVKEKNISEEKTLNWISENFGRIYLYNGIPLVLNKN